MRTNIEIDDALMTEAMQVTGAMTKKAAVEQALQALVDHARRLKAFEEMNGMGWDGDLDAMRTDLPL